MAKSRASPSPKPGVLGCLKETPRKHAPSSKAKNGGVFKSMAGMGVQQLKGGHTGLWMWAEICRWEELLYDSLHDGVTQGLVAKLPRTGQGHGRLRGLVTASLATKAKEDPRTTLSLMLCTLRVGQCAMSSAG